MLRPPRRGHCLVVVIFVRGQDGAGSPGANSRELESGPRAEVMLVADSGRTLAVFPTFSLPLVPPTGRT